jgi:hypothetical protein
MNTTPTEPTTQSELTTSTTPTDDPMAIDTNTKPELAIDEIVHISPSLTLPDPPPCYTIPPVHITMRPGNKPSDAVIDNVLHKGNEVNWPVVEWECIEGMREVNRMLEEPVMSMEELEKELEGWWE